MSECLLASESSKLVCENLAEYNEYESTLYQLFVDAYIKGGLEYNTTAVHVKYYPPTYDERSNFYHLICENYENDGDENSRKPNLERCQRILWPEEIIKNCTSRKCSRLLIWENIRKGKKNVLLYCQKLNYLVVLRAMKNYYLLVTAYPVEREHTRRKLIKEYTAYNKQRPH